MSDQWIIKKTGPQPLLAAKKKAYPEWDRANVSYSHWLSGKTMDEIVRFTGVPMIEIEKDIAHVESILPSKTLISNNNTRQRILIQRELDKKYQAKLQDALEVPVADYLRAGLNPTTPLKEYREAVGMTEKPGGFNIQVNQSNTTVGGGVSRTEDVIREVMSKINKNSSEQSENVIDAEVEEEALMESTE